MCLLLMAAMLLKTSPIRRWATLVSIMKNKFFSRHDVSESSNINSCGRTQGTTRIVPARLAESLLVNALLIILKSPTSQIIVSQLSDGEGTISVSCRITEREGRKLREHNEILRERN